MPAPNVAPEHISAIVISGIVATFSSFVGIIIWMAKGVLKKLEDNSKNYNDLSILVSNLTNTVTSLVSTVREASDNRTKLMLQQQDIENIKEHQREDRRLIELLKENQNRMERNAFYNDKDKPS